MPEEERKQLTGTTYPVKIDPVVSYAEWRETRSELMTEIRSQYDESLSIMGTLVQKAALLAAVSSLLLFELFKLQSAELIWYMGLISLVSDCIIGLCITLQGRRVSTGFNMETAIRQFNEGMLNTLQNSLMVSKYRALHNLSVILKKLDMMVDVQFFFAGIGFYSVIVLEVCNVI